MESAKKRQRPPLLVDNNNNKGEELKEVLFKTLAPSAHRHLDPTGTRIDTKLFYVYATELSEMMSALATARAATTMENPSVEAVHQRAHAAIKGVFARVANADARRLLEAILASAEEAYCCPLDAPLRAPVEGKRNKVEERFRTIMVRTAASMEEEEEEEEEVLIDSQLLTPLPSIESLRFVSATTGMMLAEFHAGCPMRGLVWERDSLFNALRYHLSVLTTHPIFGEKKRHYHEETLAEEKRKTLQHLTERLQEEHVVYGEQIKDVEIELRMHEMEVGETEAACVTERVAAAHLAVANQSLAQVEALDWGQEITPDERILREQTFLKFKRLQLEAQTHWEEAKGAIQDGEEMRRRVAELKQKISRGTPIPDDTLRMQIGCAIDAYIDQLIPFLAWPVELIACLNEAIHESLGEPDVLLEAHVAMCNGVRMRFFSKKE